MSHREHEECQLKDSMTVSLNTRMRSETHGVPAAARWYHELLMASVFVHDTIHKEASFPVAQGLPTACACCKCYEENCSSRLMFDYPYTSHPFSTHVRTGSHSRSRPASPPTHLFAIFLSFDEKDRRQLEHSTMSRRRTETLYRALYTTVGAWNC